MWVPTKLTARRETPRKPDVYVVLFDDNARTNTPVESCVYVVGAFKQMLNNVLMRITREVIFCEVLRIEKDRESCGKCAKTSCVSLMLG